MSSANRSHFFLSRILVRQEAVASSAIEGTYSTLDHLLEVEESEPTLQIQADADAQQVRSYALALEESLSNVERNRLDAFSVGMIRDLQREVMKDNITYSQNHRYLPGQFRKKGTVVHIGRGRDIARSIYNPAPPEYIRRCMTEHINYLRSTGMQQISQSIITRIALAHSHFEAIHPFPDGNGRTGRLLLPLMLAADGHTPLYLAPHIAARKAEYYDVLRAAQQRLNFPPLIEFISQTIIAAVDRSINSHNDLTNLVVDWKQRSSWRKNSAPLRALDFLPGYPVVNINRLAKNLGVSKQAASSAIKKLVSCGILIERTGFKRNKVFVAKEVLDIYNSPL